MEYHQLEMQQHLQESDKRIEEVFRRLDEGNAKQKQGVFYNGQMSHDRFLCIDDDVYHIGASIKDLGKKWFGFSKMEILAPDELVERINRG